MQKHEHQEILFLFFPTNKENEIWLLAKFKTRQKVVWDHPVKLKFFFFFTVTFFSFCFKFVTKLNSVNVEVETKTFCFFAFQQ